MEYTDTPTLEAFLASVEVSLLSEGRRVLVQYPAGSTSPWDGAALIKVNEKFLSEASGVANVYAIFTAPKTSDIYCLRYIGKTTRKLARQRLTNHLIKKDDGTGAKLAEIKSHVLSGGSVKLSWIQIQPESLRNYVEEELIQKHQEADWNRENKKHHAKSSKPKSAPRLRAHGQTVSE
jgi:hypothetical protein